MDAPPDSWLLCFDFDGTFIDQSSPETLDPALARALAFMRERGALFAINTGRSLFQAVAGVNELGMREMPDYLVAWEREIYEPTRFRRWVDLGDWNRRCRKEHKKLFRSNRKLLKQIREHVLEHSGARWIEEPEEPAGIIARDCPEMDHLCEFIDEQLVVGKAKLLSYERNTIYLRFAHAHYNKGTALGELGRELGIPAERTMAVGDNHNDLSMLTSGVAGMIACPSNTVPDVAAAVHAAGGYVASRPAGAGVADAIAHFFGGA